MLNHLDMISVNIVYVLVSGRFEKPGIGPILELMPYAYVHASVLRGLLPHREIEDA